MKFRTWIITSAAVALAAVMGCGKAGTQPAAGTADVAAKEGASSEAGHTHDGWWCTEHGVPEDICGLCSSKVAAEMQKKGDWCKEHDRPESQCFLCHPELEAKFAAQYEAKYGKKPPKREG
jgi:hypothetical protein